ncbi:molybdenum ABC transporter ATP-binding protein [Bowmanella sp. JS7-9]|uniref:Molybdenum ABC transporter ATP-binding protein n=1 Tax=Pseudobowmanella zhangzhouensis TaxID=1537679 RepID=A0ABW1XIL1_9ALTE|nr:molybdenum ABC transporter ATP-binding protein [Bowmanella sp. JS7-9]TBX27287.1 hypothetical protein TK45_00605 [Bowmanella sp. JS7-9]
MITLQLQLVRQHFDLNINTTLPTTGITAIVGRSGCGKTSLLRAIAGLEPNCQGLIQFNNQSWLTGTVALPVEKRRIGMVFQQAFLLPHLSTEQNLLYGFNRTRKQQRTLTPELIIAMLDLKPLLGLKQHQLSGGQRQRLALGRALLTSPQLLLLDEPFAGLDQQSKAEILPFLHRISQQTKIPMLLVSHQLDDIVQLADHIVLLQQGQLVTQGPLQQQLSLQAFSAFGAMSVLHCHTATSNDDTLLTLQLGKQQLMLPYQYFNGACRLRVQAKDVAISLEPLVNSSVNNQLQATVCGFTSASHPAESIVQLQVEGQPLQALVTNRSTERLRLKADMTVYVQIKAVAIY